MSRGGACNGHLTLKPLRGHNVCRYSEVHFCFNGSTETKALKHSKLYSSLIVTVRGWVNQPSKSKGVAKRRSMGVDLIHLVKKKKKNKKNGGLW